MAVPDHAVPAGRARRPAVRGGADDLAHARRDGGVRGARGPDPRPAGTAGSPGRGRVRASGVVCRAVPAVRQQRTGVLLVTYSLFGAGFGSPAPRSPTASCPPCRSPGPASPPGSTPRAASSACRWGSRSRGPRPGIVATRQRPRRVPARGARELASAGGLRRGRAPPQPGHRRTPAQASAATAAACHGCGQRGGRGRPVSSDDLLATVIRPRMAGWGITRLADVTGLDYLGIPLAAAVTAARRPGPDGRGRPDVWRRRDERRAGRGRCGTPPRPSLCQLPVAPPPRTS